MARSAFQGIVSVEAESDVRGREFRIGRLRNLPEYQKTAGLQIYHKDVETP